MKLITSWDDGAIQDIRLAGLLLKYKMPAIFYIPNTTQLGNGDLKFLAENFEIGGHTLSHPPDMTKLSDEELDNEIGFNREWCQEWSGQEVESFCYPKGRYNDKVVEAVKRAGFKEARTTTVLNYEEPEDEFLIKTSVHVYPTRKEYTEYYSAYGEYVRRKWHEVAKNLYNKAKGSDKGYFHLWGHSWELDKFDTWERLEEFLKYIRSN